jgi:hypothetical protein
MKRILLFAILLLIPSYLYADEVKVECQCNEIAEWGKESRYNKNTMEVTLIDPTPTGDPFKDDKGYITTIPDTYNEHGDAMLFLRVIGNKLELGIYWGRYIGTKAWSNLLTVRFDRGEIWDIYAYTTTKGNGSFFMQPCFMLSNIMNSSTLAVRVLDCFNSLVTVTFDLTELKQVLADAKYKPDIAE